MNPSTTPMPQPLQISLSSDPHENWYQYVKFDEKFKNQGLEIKKFWEVITPTRPIPKIEKLLDWSKIVLKIDTSTTNYDRDIRKFHPGPTQPLSESRSIDSLTNNSTTQFSRKDDRFNTSYISSSIIIFTILLSSSTIIRSIYNSQSTVPKFQYWCCI